MRHTDAATSTSQCFNTVAVSGNTSTWTYYSVWLLDSNFPLQKLVREIHGIEYFGLAMADRVGSHALDRI